MADGEIKISTKLESSEVEKGLKKVESEIKKTGQDITNTMNKAEKSINNLGKSFKGVDGSKLAKQFKSVENSIDSTNKKIEQQQQKLTKLKSALSSATDVKQKDTLTAQITKAETEITKLEGKIKSLNQQKIQLNINKNALNDLDGNFKSGNMINELDKVEKKAEKTGKAIKESLTQNFGEKLGDKVNDIGDSISKVGDKLTSHVTLPIVGIGVAAAKMGMDFDSQMSRVKAISGATGEEFKQLHDQAMDLGAQTAFSSKQAAEGMENLASAGFNTKEIMAAMPGMLDLAASSGEGLASSADIAASTLRGFGLAADQAGHVADVLAKNAGATNAAVGDTGEAMKYIAPVAHSMNLSLEETTAAIGLLANAGIKGSQAGTTLRSSLIRLASPADTAAAAMDAIGFKAFDAQGKMLPFKDVIDRLTKSLKGKTDQQKADYISTIFGQEALSGMLALVDAGSGQLDQLTQSYKGADGAASDMAKTMQDNSKSAIEQMSGSIETAAIKLEEVAAPAITKIAGQIEEAANKFGELSPEMQEFYIKAALGAAAIGPVLKVFGGLNQAAGLLIKYGSKIVSMFGAIGGAAEVGEGAIAGLGLAGGIAAGAISLLGVGIAGAVTYNGLLGKSLTTSTDDLNLWEKAVNACTGSTIKSKAELQKAGLIYKDFGEGVSDSFKEGIEKATDTYHDFEMLLVKSDIGKKITDENKTQIKSAIDNIVNGAKSSISSRKGEIQSELSKMFNSKDGISIDEQAVLDEAANASDEKLKKIDEIQKEITGVWEKAIAEHGKLSEEDVSKIKEYLKQVQQIRAEVEAKNTAESDFAKNQYSERLNGMSAEDAKKEYQSASGDLSKKFADAKATYKTGMDDLQKMVKDYNDQAAKAEDENSKKDLEAKAQNIQKQIDAKKKEYDDLINTEKSKRREYLDLLYKKDSSLDGKFNEVTGEMLSSKDKYVQGNLAKLKDTFGQIRDVTETGMIQVNKPVQDANGQWKDNWHDIYVTVDQATGNITSAYDTLTGEVGGYSEKFQSQAKETGDKIKAEMDSLKRAINNGSGIKLDGKNILNASTGDLITGLDKVIEKADGTKTAIQNINGTKVKLEFDKDGTLTNYKDVLAVINNQAKDNPAVIKSKIEVDGEEISTIDEAIKKLKELPEDSKAKITIDGEDIPTIDEAIKKLSEIPEDKNTKINIDTDSAKGRLAQVQSALDRLKSKNIDVTINYNKQESDILDQEKRYSRAVQKELQVDNNYTGTGGGSEGLTEFSEHGWEITTGENELYYLGGGTGILDHGSSQSAMRNEVSAQVGSSMGGVIKTLIGAMSSQSGLLGQLVKNTLEMVSTGKEGNKLNEQLAKDLVTKYKSNSGTFDKLNNELNTAQQSKEHANSLTIDQNKWYSDSKSRMDDVVSQLDKLRDTMDETTDETTKKELEKQQKVLEKQKDTLQDEVNYYKDAAEKEIETCKKNADEQVKIAEAKKEKLTQFAEAISNALKTELEGQKAAAEKTINDELESMEKAYNKKTADIDKRTKAKQSAIDKQIKALEEESTDTSRQDERDEANNNIYTLKQKQANTADIYEKEKYQIQIDKAQKELNKKESAWSVEDKKAELEQEKELLSEKADNEKKSLEESYDTKKKAKEKELKDTDAYYNKLLETDSLNAQTRYIMLNGSQQDLVTLLQSYNPQWQDAGQSLADSLLTGLNSQKESIADSVSEMLDIKNGVNELPGGAPVYNGNTGKLIRGGYATGTTNNPTAGYYYTNEVAPEMSTKGNVAYVEEGAGIANAMQTKDFITSEIKDEISKQIALMKASYQTTRLNDITTMFGKLAGNTNNSNITNNNNGGNLNVQNLHLYNQNDVEQFANELGFMRIRQTVD